MGNKAHLKWAAKLLAHCASFTAVLDTAAISWTSACRNHFRFPLARSATHMGVVARAERNATAGIDGIRRLVELRDGVALREAASRISGTNLAQRPILRLVHSR